ncbi:hypothetical protein CCACVL1_13897 [Corchorus capsularis]|uniref:AAA+ ATPase domain-containing protein n=1 Tax=Corchorus capsularis TaxID=210143 RepID=A0A1R3I976_COCAP|nr:hypothetical protein CCACVL1_13897 [Corchorus capsularis]
MMVNWVSQLSSTLASIMFVWHIFKTYFPPTLQIFLEKNLQKFTSLFNPNIEITFHEYSSDGFRRSEAYKTIENYLSSKSTEQASKLKADVFKDGKCIVLHMEDYEEVSDVFQGIKLSWSKVKSIPRTQVISYYASATEKRHYKLSFHKRYRDQITKNYLKFVLEKGKEIAAKNRQRKLYTNVSWQSYSKSRRNMWSHVVFEHPASFDTLAMDPVKKKEIMEELVNFSQSKDYYARIGKAWKRGYLLYGPPGTGKSTMIAAIANFLNYDIYDLELTSVADNTDLRNLLIETSSKSIIVIEDIDCSLDIANQRKKKKEAKEKKTSGMEEEEDQEDDNKNSKITLSGLLNFIDGIWSASCGERIIIFTTNYVEKLDQALIRSGRMDKHIELSYCKFEGFKVLAKNYLGLESHNLFDIIENLLEETNISPADVAESLMPKNIKGDAETCLENLIQALKTAKEEAKKKAEEVERLKAEEGIKRSEFAEEAIKKEEEL